MIKIAFIGAGRMASAMVGGLLKEKHFEPQEIACTCGNDPTGPQLSEKTGIRYVPDLEPLMQDAETIVLACKPQQFEELSAEISELSAHKLIVSILAGTTIDRIAGKFNQARNIVRAMPNTPGQIGAGITGYASKDTLASADEQTVAKILGSLGAVISLEETQIDAVTAISGSGPAYVFEFAAALRAGGEKLGLSPEIAEKLALQTIYGAAKLLETTGEDPETLRNNVTSPGGTTQAALESMSEAGFRELIYQAVQAAHDRSIELSKI